MFESSRRLREDVQTLLDSLRALAEGRYAALFDARGVLAESPQAGGEGEWVVRRFVQERAAELFRIPARLHSGEAMDDAFADWAKDEFFLAFVNGRVGMIVACPDAERVEAESGELLGVMVDRLLRLNPGWRLDEKGRGLLAGRPRLDTVAIGRAAGETDPPA
jgi:hypothetical protein